MLFLHIHLWFLVSFSEITSLILVFFKFIIPFIWSFVKINNVFVCTSEFLLQCNKEYSLVTRKPQNYFYMFLLRTLVLPAEVKGTSSCKGEHAAFDTSCLQSP